MLIIILTYHAELQLHSCSMLTIHNRNKKQYDKHFFAPVQMKLFISMIYTDEDVCRDLVTCQSIPILDSVAEHGQQPARLLHDNELSNQKLNKVTKHI